MTDLLSRVRQALEGRYRIEREAGHGGAAVVFVAQDLKHHRTVAIKVLRPEVTGALGAERFLREIRTAAQLSHPNIVSLIDSGEADGLLFYVMFYVEGESLRERLDREQQLPIDEALRITREVAEALSYAHGRGLVHRDIKPENILFEAGHAVVTDFGIAMAMEQAGGDRLTETGLAIGTPVYMSPEQATGMGHVDTRTDIYSVACVLYEMLAGSPPWTGVTPQVMLARKTLEPAPGLRVARSTVPAAVEAAIGRALLPTPADRQGTIEEFIESLAVTRSPSRPLAERLKQPLVLGLAVLFAGLVIGTVARFTNNESTAASIGIVATFDPVTSVTGVEDSPSLSPDGQWIVYSGDGDGDRDIYLRSINGERVIPLTGDSRADDTQPAFSPDGARIAFHSSRDGGGIFVMGRTGEGVRRVTGDGYNPAWSPDGTRLVYGLENVGLKPLNGERRSELWVVSIDGGNPVRISGPGLDFVDPSWSPNGHRIAFTARNGQAQFDIMTMLADGGDPVAVTNDPANDWSPVWAGDGQHIYFVSDRGGSMNLWRVEIDELTGRVRGPVQPIGAPATFVAHPSVSADGRLIAYSSVVTSSQNIQTASFDPVTGALKEIAWLTTGTRPWSNPDPTPDGQSVTFYTQDRPEGDIYILSSDGGGQVRQLTADSAIDRVPRWSPDGSHILYFSNRSGRLEVWTIRADGSDNRQITAIGAGVGTWSPDGARIAASTGRTVAILEADPDAPSDDAAVEWLPAPDSALGRFTVNDWSPDGKTLAGSQDYRDTGIITYSLDTGTFAKLSDFGQWPVWLPDSRHILFVSGGNAFYILDTVSRTAEVIYTSPWDVIGPPRLSRDARRIFFSRRATEADIWLVTLR